MPPCVIAPSILSADFARLGDEVNAVLKAGADWVHFDVMDNHYVPNLTIGPLVCEALRKHGITAPIDVHLMVEPVDRIVPDFAKAGASVISFHPEASRHVDRTILRAAPLARLERAPGRRDRGHGEDDRRPGVQQALPPLPGVLGLLGREVLSQRDGHDLLEVVQDPVVVVRGPSRLARVRHPHLHARAAG